MSDYKVEYPGLYSTLLQSTVKFDDALELIVNLVQAQCSMLVAAQVERGEPQDVIAKTLDSFQSFINLMDFTAEGILHLFQGFATGHLSTEEVVNLYMELAAVHDGREEGLISKRLNSNGLLEVAMEAMETMNGINAKGAGDEIKNGAFKFVTPSKDEYGPN